MHLSSRIPLIHPRFDHTIRILNISRMVILLGVPLSSQQRSVLRICMMQMLVCAVWLLATGMPAAALVHLDFTKSQDSTSVIIPFYNGVRTFSASAGIIVHGSESKARSPDIDMKVELIINIDEETVDPACVASRLSDFSVFYQHSSIVAGLCSSEAPCDTSFEWDNASHYGLGNSWYRQTSESGLVLKETFAREFIWEQRILQAAESRPVSEFALSANLVLQTNSCFGNVLVTLPPIYLRGAVRKTQALEFTGEFSQELLEFIPYVFYLKSHGLLSSTVLTYSGMRPLYFFLDKHELQFKHAPPRRFVYYHDRAYIPPEIRPTELLRNRGILNRTSLKQFQIPPYYDFYRKVERQYSWMNQGKPIAYVYNKFMRLSRQDVPPLSFFSKDFLLLLLSKLSASHTVIYNHVAKCQQPVGYSADVQHLSAGAFGHSDSLSERSQVEQKCSVDEDLDEKAELKRNGALMFEDLVEEAKDTEDTYNFLNAFVAARSSLFVGIFGGHVDFCLHFPGSHVIYKAPEDAIGFTLDGVYEAFNPAVFYENLFLDYHSNKSGSFLNVTSSYGEVAAAVDAYLARQNISPKEEIFSHVQCSHLSHDVVFPPAVHFTGLVPLELYAPPDTQRACLLSNVCLNFAGEMEFYVHPRSAKLPPNYVIDGLKNGLVRLEGIGGMPWAPVVKRSSVPSDFEFNDDADVHLYSSFVANNNFGHNLIDNVFAHYFAMQHFNVGGYNSSRLVSAMPCVSDQPGSCDMLLLMIQGIFSKSPRSFDDYNGATCFRKLIVGQQSAWGLGSGYSKAGPSLRSFREEFFHNLNFNFGEAPKEHRVNVYVKSGGWNGPVWPDVCELLPRIVELFAEGIDVQCVDLASQSLESQFATVSRATVHVTPHGALSYLLMFARSGSSSVMLVDSNCETLHLNPNMCRGKEMHFMPYLPWVSTFYYKRGEGEGDSVIDLISHAILEASFHMGIKIPAFAPSYK